MGRKKREIKLKEPIRIREKQLNDGNISLYLDIYYQGARKKEGLKLYLVPEINASAKLAECEYPKISRAVEGSTHPRHSAERHSGLGKCKTFSVNTHRLG